MVKQEAVQNQTGGGGGDDAGGGGGDAGLATLSYAAGAAALTPTAAAAPLASGARARTVNLLSPSEEREAVKYNRQQGFSRAAIQAYQRVVNTPDDGDFGKNTVEAIARFQQQNGLGIDGKIGPRTRHSLDAMRNKPDTKPTDHPPEADQDKDPPIREGGLTANFTLAEFKSHDGAAFPKWVIPNLKELAQQLEVLRTATGASIHINSGYRSPAHNAAVGGAKNSQHMKGEAADISVSGLSPRQVREKILGLIAKGKMKQGGIGLYSTFVHYDTRGYAARW